MIQIGHSYIPTAKTGFFPEAVLVLDGLDRAPIAAYIDTHGLGVDHPSC